MQEAAPQCYYCDNMDARTIKDGRLFITCPAFPDGVPVSIVENKRDHRKPYRGDNGVVFTSDVGHGGPGGVMDRIFPKDGGRK